MTGKIFIDLEGVQVGRACSFIAKQALLGIKVIVLNCEKAIVSGKKSSIVSVYKGKRSKGGSALKGPFYSKDTEKIVKRCVRGMLPDYRLGRGREAWKRVLCFNGVPEEYKNEKLVKIKMNPPRRYISLGELKKII